MKFSPLLLALLVSAPVQLLGWSSNPTPSDTTAIVQETSKRPAQLSKNVVNEVTTEQELNDIARSHKNVVVKFYAEWCGPCKKLKPEVEKLAKNNDQNVIYVGVNIDKAEKLASKFKVKSLPTIVFIKDGKEVHRQVGGQNGEQLKAVIRKHLA